MTTLDTRCVLVPSDFGPAARRALSQARALAGGAGVLHTAFAVPSRIHQVLQAPEHVSAIREQLARWEDEAEVPADHRHVVTGDPGRAIARLARELGATLVVAPAHRLGVVERMFLGSTAERLAREAPCDVLLIPPQGAALVRPGSHERVLVGWDGSASSLRAARLAVEMARDPHDVTAVHVLPEVPAYLEEGLWSEELERVGHEETSRDMRRSLATQDAHGVRIRIEAGSPGLLLADLATHLGVELVVVGARGESGLDHGLGPVAAGVLRRSRLPVLLARRPARQGA